MAPLGSLSAAQEPWLLAETVRQMLQQSGDLISDRSKKLWSGEADVSDDVVSDNNDCRRDTGVEKPSGDHHRL